MSAYVSEEGEGEDGKRERTIYVRADNPNYYPKLRLKQQNLDFSF